MFEKLESVNLVFTCELSVHIQSRILAEVSLSAVKTGLRKAQNMLQTTTREVNQFRADFTSLREKIVSLKTGIESGELMKVIVAKAELERTKKKRKRTKIIINQEGNGNLTVGPSSNDNALL